jgi:succinyl-CoA synthetase beta subunit
MPYLNEAQATRMLTQAGVPMAPSWEARDRKEAEAAARAIAAPLVIKILSPDILHKSDAGCVRVGVPPEEAGAAFDAVVENARRFDPGARIEGALVRQSLPAGLEMFIGLKRDPQFGPVVVAGMGGIYLEVLEDYALRLAPVTPQEAADMVSQMKAGKIIMGARGTRYDRAAFENAIVRVSHMAEDPRIVELDVNPFFLYEAGQGGMGVDALIRLDP